MPEEYVPPVVAIVVASDPGVWFEECLGSLGAQDYPNLDVLVVDDASADDLAPRVATALPGAVLRRHREHAGLAASANEALNGIDGASFFLFCHDDVALDDDAVRRLVEESFRSNAGIVGPKLVSFDDSSRLLEMGLGVDRRGRAVSRVLQGELDQSQHDSAREVFAVPGACLLSRADLFIALDGFDPELDASGEDVDLCWRAQLAGARVVVAPPARARHREATSAGERADAGSAALGRSHQLRSVLKNYSAPRRAHTLLVLGLGALAHALVGPLLPGRRTKSGALAALSWNLSRRGSLVEARRAVKRARQLSDRKLASAMIRSRGSQYLGEPSRSQHPGDAGAVDHPGIPTAGAVRETAHAYMQPEIDHVSHLVERLRAGEVRPAPIVTVLVVVALMLLGLRGVLSPPLPVLGDLVPLASGSSLVAHFFLGTGDPGWARELGASPPAGALLGVLSMVLGNSSALALKVVLLGAGAVGAIGTVHILGCLGPSRDDSGSLAAAQAPSPPPQAPSPPPQAPSPPPPWQHGVPRGPFCRGGRGPSPVFASWRHRWSGTRSLAAISAPQSRLAAFPSCSAVWHAPRACWCRRSPRDSRTDRSALARAHLPVTPW